MHSKILELSTKPFGGGHEKMSNSDLYEYAQSTGPCGIDYIGERIKLDDEVFERIIKTSFPKHSVEVNARERWFKINPQPSPEDDVYGLSDIIKQWEIEVHGRMAMARVSENMGRYQILDLMEHFNGSAVLFVFDEYRGDRPRGGVPTFFDIIDSNYNKPIYVGSVFDYHF